MWCMLYSFSNFGFQLKIYTLSFSAVNKTTP
jgi:hypothetical protein